MHFLETEYFQLYSGNHPTAAGSNEAVCGSPENDELFQRVAATVPVRKPSTVLINRILDLLSLDHTDAMIRMPRGLRSNCERRSVLLWGTCPRSRDGV